MIEKLPRVKLLAVSDYYINADQTCITCNKITKTTNFVVSDGMSDESSDLNKYTVAVYHASKSSNYSDLTGFCTNRCFNKWVRANREKVVMEMVKDE